MKRILIILALLVCSILSLNAQHIHGGRYKGFVDFDVYMGNDGMFGSGGIYELSKNLSGVGFMTSHGFQINPQIYFGGGFSIKSYALESFGEFIANIPGLSLSGPVLNQKSIVIIPIFVHFRANMNKKRFSPFFDVKVGYTPSVLRGICFLPSFGVRFGLIGNLGLNLGAGVAVQGYKCYSYQTIKTGYMKSLNVSLGLDF